MNPAKKFSSYIVLKEKKEAFGPEIVLVDQARYLVGTKVVLLGTLWVLKPSLVDLAQFTSEQYYWTDPFVRNVLHFR